MIRCAGRLVGGPWHLNRLFTVHKDLWRGRVSWTGTTVPTQSTKYVLTIDVYLVAAPMTLACFSAHCPQREVVLVGLHRYTCGASPLSLNLSKYLLYTRSWMMKKKNITAFNRLSRKTREFQGFCAGASNYDVANALHSAISLWIVALIFT